MEIAGMSLSIVALVSLFENAITCFTRVRMAKDFGSDVKLFMVRLEILHLRLTRWGEAVGLNRPSKPNEAPSSNLRRSDQTLAIKALEQITKRFDDAAKAAQDINIGEDNAASGADLGDKKTLVERMRAMSIKRHPRTSAISKAKWVTYQKDELSGLIQDLSNSLNDLDHVLPAGSASLTSICDDEVSQLLNDAGLHQVSVTMLEEVAGKLDEKLADAIARHKAKANAGAPAHNHHNFKAVNVSSTLNGDQNVTWNF